jgi:integrase
MRALKLSTLAYMRNRDLDSQQRRTFRGAYKVLCNALSGMHGDKFENLRMAPRDVDSEITADMTISQLADVWIDELLIEGRVKPQTIGNYTDNLHYLILPGIGDLTIAQATVGALDRYLKALARTRPSGAQRCKGTLLQMFSVAVRHGAIPANPVREVGRLPKPRRLVQAMTPEDIKKVREALHVWRTTKAVGPKKSSATTDIFDLLLATGCRIGEACALRWRDIDLDKGTLTVAGTMVFLKTTGWERQDFPKTLAGNRTVYLPPFGLTLLRKRWTEVPSRPADPVFASRRGTHLQPDNVRRSLRCALQQQVDLKWVSPHVFRKTVATVLSGQGLVTAAAAQLGHVNEDITKKFYVMKSKTAPDVSHALEVLIG